MYRIGNCHWQYVDSVAIASVAHHNPAELPEPTTQEIPLARDLTTCVLDFVRDRVTPVAEWVTWTGGDPELVILVVTETLRSIADGLDSDEQEGDEAVGHESRE